jgi:hypothetical protein
MTLTVVESAPSVALSLDPSRDPLTGTPEDEESHNSIIASRKTRVTSGVRSTFRHLRAEGGFYAPVRGIVSTFYLAIIFIVVMGFSSTITGLIVGDNMGMLAGSAIACVATAKWNMALVQLRIASPESNKNPENKNIFKRGKHLVFAIVKPTIAALTFIQLYQEVFKIIMMAFVPKKGDEAFDKPYTVHFKEDGSHDIEYGKVSAWFYVVATIFYVGYVGIVLPCKAVLVRMQASGMAPEDDTIIAVDKTFGVEAAGERERTLTFMEAVKTFSREDIRSIVIMGVKLIGLETIQLLVYALIVYISLMSVAGKTISNIINAQMQSLAREGSAAA